MRQINERSMERLAGTSFWLSTAAYMTGSAWIEEALGAAQGPRFQMQLLAGIGFEWLNSALVIAIGYLFFLRLKALTPKKARLYLTGRWLEGVLLGIASVLTLWVGEIPGFLYFRSLAFNLAMIILSAVSIPLLFEVARSKRAPICFMGLGIMGYMALTVYSLWALISVSSPTLWLMAPGGIFELAFPFWLLFKGFKSDSPI